MTGDSLRGMVGVRWLRICKCGVSGCTPGQTVCTMYQFFPSRWGEKRRKALIGKYFLLSSFWSVWDMSWDGAPVRLVACAALQLPTAVATHHVVKQYIGVYLDTHIVLCGCGGGGWGGENSGFIYRRRRTSRPARAHDTAQHAADGVVAGTRPSSVLFITPLLTLLYLLLRLALGYRYCFIDCHSPCRVGPVGLMAEMWGHRLTVVGSPSL